MRTLVYCIYSFVFSPESIKSRNDVFYLVPETSCVPDSPVWYSTQPLGEEPMTKMLNRVRVVKEIQEAHLHHHHQPNYMMWGPTPSSSSSSSAKVYACDDDDYPLLLQYTWWDYRLLTQILYVCCNTFCDFVIETIVIMWFWFCYLFILLVYA